MPALNKKPPEPQLFRVNFGSYNKRVTKRISQPGLFGNTPGWITLTSPLTDKTILEAVFGKKIYGYYSAGYTPAFGIDIDVHNGEGKKHAQKIYKELINRLNFPASALAISTGGEGLHAFYFLLRPLPFLVLNNALSALLAGLPIEIKPTTSTSLRIPPENSFINPITLEKESRKWKTIVSNALKHEPYELFGDRVSPDTLRASFKNKKKNAMLKIYKLEGIISPILPGNTNEAVKKLGFVYAINDTPIDYAVSRFQELLHPDYRGELRQSERLTDRFQNIYNRVNKQGFIPIEKDNDVLFDTDEITDRYAAEKILSLIPAENFQRKALKTGSFRKETLLKLIMTIIEWHKHLNKIYNDTVWRAYWNFCYKGFANNIKRGYYPLPVSVMEKAVKRPDRGYTEILEEIGFLEPAFWKPWFDYSGNGQGGGCKHYKMPLLDTAEVAKAKARQAEINSRKFFKTA